MSWLSKIFGVKPHQCMYNEGDIYVIDDPKCVFCGKNMSVACSEKGEKFEGKSIKRIIEEMDQYLKKQP